MLVFHPVYHAERVTANRVHDVGGIDVAVVVVIVGDHDPRILGGERGLYAVGILNAYVLKADVEQYVLGVVCQVVAVARSVVDGYRIVGDPRTVEGQHSDDAFVWKRVECGTGHGDVHHVGDGFGQSDGDLTAYDQAGADDLTVQGEGDQCVLEVGLDGDVLNTDEGSGVVLHCQVDGGGGTHHGRTVTKHTPGVHHFFTAAAVVFYHAHRAVEVYASEGLADVLLADFSNQIHHFVLAFHRRCP